MWTLKTILSKFTPKSSNIFLNKDGSILTWNPGMEDIEGYTANEIVGKKFNVFFSPTNSSYALESLLNITSKKGRSKLSGIHFRKDGSIYRGSITLKAIRDEEKSLIGFDLYAKARK
jgi:PAS domain S-box-containing protein